MKIERMLRRIIAAALAGAMAFSPLPALSEEAADGEEEAVLVIIEKKGGEAPAVEADGFDGARAEAPATDESETLTALDEETAPINVSAAEPDNNADFSSAADPVGAGPMTAPDGETLPSFEPDPAEETVPANDPSAEETLSSDPFGMEAILPELGEETPEVSADPSTESDSNAEPSPAVEAEPVTGRDPVEETLPSGDPFGRDSILPELGEETPEVSADPSAELDSNIESSPSAEAETVTGPAEGTVPPEAALPTEKALGAKAQGIVTACSLETVNGFATLRFTIDGRYEGTICGLTPFTTEAEAYLIAENAAAQLFASGGGFSIADADRYTGFTDSAGAAYGEQQNRVRKAEEELAVTTDPAERARLIGERNAALERIVGLSGSAELQRKYELWNRDQDDPDLRRELDDEIAVEIAETRRAYEATRGYEKMNAVFEGQSPIDAEKNSFVNYYLPEAEQDSAMCWAASAADMLWYSGWGAQAENPLTGSNFSDEDELFDWLRTAFENSGAKQNTGIQYLFKGITPDAFSLGYANPRSGYYDPDDPYALLAQYAADMLVSTKESTDDPAGIASMLGALNDGSAVGLSVYSPSYTSGHAVTAFGQIVDTFAADPAAALRAVFIADSDGDVPKLSEEEYNGGLREDGQQDPADRMNAYRMLKTGVYTDPYTGGSAIRLEDYNGWLLAGVTVLAPCTEEVRQNVGETDPDATLNAANTPDLVPTDIGVVSKNAAGTLNDIYKEGEPLMAVLRVKDESGVALPGNRDIPVLMQLYRLDKKTGEVTELVETFDFTWDYAIAANKKSTESWDIGDALEPGVYRMDLGSLNADHTVTEAYYINNINVDGYVFTIVAIPLPASAGGRERRGTFAVYEVYAVVLDPSEPAHIAFVTPDGKGGVRPFTAETAGAALWYENEVVDPALWSVTRGEKGGLELVLEPEYLTGLGTGEHLFTLSCRDARVLFYVTVAPPLGA